MGQAVLLENELIEKAQTDVLRLYNRLKQKQFSSPGLLAGELGKALFLTSSYLSAVCRDEETIDLLYTSLNDSISGIESFAGGTLYSLSDGLPGLAIVLNILNEHELLDNDSEDMLKEVEQQLYEVVDRHISDIYAQSGFDYFYGVTGIGNAFASFSKSAVASRVLELVCKVLAENVERTSAGLTWQDKKLFGRQPYNLGIAHGVLSVIVLLSKAISQYNFVQFKPLLTDAADWYLAQENSKNVISRFSCSIGRNGEEKESMNRLAWCYGDLSAAIALIHAYEATGICRYLDKARIIIDHSLPRTNLALEIDNAEGDIFDSGLCHGFAALVLCYRSIAGYFGDKIYYGAYEFWLRALIQRSTTGPDGTNCFKIKRDPDGNKFEESLSFLEGACGVGALLNAINNDEVFRILSSLFMTDIKRTTRSC